jgi:hypothetical protein
LFYEILDVRQERASSFALLVLGMNSIAASTKAFKTRSSPHLLRHFTRTPFRSVGPVFEATLLGSRVFGVDLAGVVVDAAPQGVRAPVTPVRTACCESAHAALHV